MRGCLVALVAALAATAPAAPALAARCPKASLADVENEVMCLVCGVPLALADAPQAERERAFVRHLISRCRSKDEIKAALVAQYGTRVLALPKASGFRLTAYLVPGIAAVAAAAAIGLAAVRWQRRRRPRSPEVIPPAPQLDPVETAQLEADLERYRE
jgi:cytochrome c-type biogenesis protein CcmH